MVEVDRNGLEVLDRTQCERLLATATIGRIAFTSGALPIVLPVNFWFDGSRVLIRTGRGTKLEAAARDAVVAFEVDDIDPMAHTGWSVVLTGIASEVTDAAHLRQLERAPIARWAPGGNGCVMMVTPELISGRRMNVGGGGL
jgi:nitroimidazol reductase NimA-like FMN-containing flavoprotein (pyridoxamine 5'-phosphate oxidase superfamily)